MPVFQIALPFFACVELVAVDDIAREEILGAEVHAHGAEQDKIFVDARVRQRYGPPNRERREHAVVAEDLEHRHRDVRGGLEGELPVEREVPDHREHQRDEVGQAVFVAEDLVQIGVLIDVGEFV